MEEEEEEERTGGEEEAPASAASARARRQRAPRPELAVVCARPMPRKGQMPRKRTERDNGWAGPVGRRGRSQASAQAPPRSWLRSAEPPRARARERERERERTPPPITSEMATLSAEEQASRMSAERETLMGMAATVAWGPPAAACRGGAPRRGIRERAHGSHGSKLILDQGGEGREGQRWFGGKEAARARTARWDHSRSVTRSWHTAAERRSGTHPGQLVSAT